MGVIMNGKNIQKNIDRAFDKAGYIDIKSVCYKDHREPEYKNGLYLIYDNNSNKRNVIYVGMVSDAKTASLYNRIIGNGNSAHNKKKWFKKAGYVKFIKFDKWDKEQLQIAERLMILYYKPVYNDVDTSEKTLKKYKWEI